MAPETGPRPRHSLDDDGGQIVFLALVGFIPLLLLTITVLDTGLVIHDRVRRQNAADAAALASVREQAIVLNLVSGVNVSTTYLLGEAIAEEAFLRALRRISRAYSNAIQRLEGEECDASDAPAECEHLDRYRSEQESIEAMQEKAGQSLPQLCAFPGQHGQAEGGRLFTLMRDLNGFGAALTSVEALDHEMATEIARDNGEEGALLAADRDQLNVQQGRFKDLGDPTRTGSSESGGDGVGFRRGYEPLLGLDWGEGPLVASADFYRKKLMASAAGSSELVSPGRIFNQALDEVYEEWMGPESHGSKDTLLPKAFMLSGIATPDDVGLDREARQALCLVWGRRTALLAEPMLGGEESTHSAYAQAEVYNATSWDLFTQDWRVRLVPASLLEREHVPAHVLGAAPAGLDVGSLFTLPVKVAQWVNAH